MLICFVQTIINTSLSFPLILADSRKPTNDLFHCLSTVNAMSFQPLNNLCCKFFLSKDTFKQTQIKICPQPSQNPSGKMAAFLEIQLWERLLRSGSCFRPVSFSEQLTRVDCSSRDMAYQGTNHCQPTAQPEKEIHAFSRFQLFWKISGKEIENRLCIPGASLQRKDRFSLKLLKHFFLMKLNLSFRT